ncbi:DUF4381 domain-containing protein [Pseudomonas sp. H1h]|uniref:DUF4381 domain-containing protein n=1 Tax=Pseudomonas sp. H1h TaxID=1397280 RepID=UPI0004692769|nr:DUF4381 domain-containing protein [Pseudomonas sp. H1h]
MTPNIPSIDQLQELGLPAPVSYAPQTWGWWVLLAILLLSAMLMGLRRYRQWRRDQYRREALQRLAQLRGRSDDLSALRELPELLKRAALSIPAHSRHWNARPVGASLLAKRSAHRTSMSPGTPLSRVNLLPQGLAALGGLDWQRYLQQHCKKALPADFSAQLALLAYAPDATLRALPAEQRQALFDICQHWVEQHHVAA